MSLVCDIIIESGHQGEIFVEIITHDMLICKQGSTHMVGKGGFRTVVPHFIPGTTHFADIYHCGISFSLTRFDDFFVQLEG